MQKENERAKPRGAVKRIATVVIAAVAVAATAGTAIAGTVGSSDSGKQAANAPAAQTAAANAPDPGYKAKKLGFFETYRGHHIMGWGAGEAACAYIDGKRLGLFPAPGGMYTSSVQGYQPERGVRAITKASVRALGEFRLAGETQPSATCPDFKVPATRS